MADDALLAGEARAALEALEQRCTELRRRGFDVQLVRGNRAGQALAPIDPVDLQLVVHKRVAL
jgi:hypothetical protein